MKKLIVGFMLSLILCMITLDANAEYKFAENWTWKDTAYQAAFVGLAAADWRQTHWMANNDWYWDGHQHKEMNPFLGSNPDSGKVDKLIPLGIFAHTIVALALPPRSVTEEQEKNGKFNINYRRIWQTSFILIEIAATGNNYFTGVGFAF